MAKGGAFENELCKRFSLWWSKGMRQDIFERTRGSGSKFTCGIKRGEQDKTSNWAGDMMACDPIGKPLVDYFFFEFKTGYAKAGLSVLNILDKKRKIEKPILLKWWEKAQEERKKSGRKETLIVFRTFTFFNL